MKTLLKNIRKLFTAYGTVLFVALLLLSGTWKVRGQSTVNYTFASATNGSLTDMSSGTTNLVVPSSTLADNASALTNIGFDFWFMGTRYTQFSGNTNGLVRFGGTVVTTDYTNDLNQATDLPFLSAFWDDFGCASPIIAKVHYKVTGTAPNRVLIIEWKDFLFVYSATAGAASTFQVRLYETAGTIEYVYGAMNNATTAQPTTASIGFSIGNADNSLISVTDISTPAVTRAAASVVDILVNNTTDGAIAGLDGTTDGSRVKYTFSQTIPTAPTSLTFTDIAITSMTLNWVDNASNEFGYAIFTSTDDITYTFNSQTVAGVTSKSLTGLTGNTKYYIKVYAVREGAVSSALTGNQITATAFTQSGAGSWVAPCQVTSVIVECWGGGGGGGNSANGTVNGGTGGGGGAFSKSTISVTPGNTYYFSTGTAGSGGPSGVGNATAGGDSWFNTVNSPPASTAGVLAKGGGLGGNNGGAAGAGGLAGSGYGTTKFSGGNGGVGAGNGGAGGGSSAGTAANGATAASSAGSAGATAPAGGGNGGDGHTTSNGLPGSVPGGGGGGSNDAASATGGAGALGQIILYYSVNGSTAPTGASATVTTGCSSYSTTLTQTGGTLATGASWYWYSGSCGGTLVGTSTAANASLTRTVTSNTTFYVRAEGGDCSITTTCASVAVTVAATPTTSNAGPDQGVCSMCTDLVLAANNPTAGTGAWSVTSGPSTLSTQFSNTATYNATFTPAGGNGTYLLRWTISNSPCTASSDEVSIQMKNSASTWSLGSAGTLVRTRSTSSNNWQTTYEGGISTIPATAYWIVRKTIADNPSTSAISAFYPNLTIESNFGAWTTGIGSYFSGAGGFPTIKGNLDIGGAGSSTVDFWNINTNASPVLVKGNVTVRSGNTLRNGETATTATGFEIQGNLTVDGTLNYGTAAGTRIIKFSGGNTQTISGTGTLSIYNCEINKSANNVNVNKLATVNNVLTLTAGHFVSPAAARLTLAATATVSPTGVTGSGSATSFVSGYLDRVQNTNGTTYDYPMGDAASNFWRPVSMTALDATSRTWTVQMIKTNPTTALGNTYQSGELIVAMNTSYYFEISRAPVSGSVDLKHYYQDGDFTGAEGSAVIGHWTGTQWNNWSRNTIPDWNRSGTNNWVQVLNVGTFSPTGPGGGDATPIELVNFSAILNNNNSVDLKWTTASEKNTSHFIVQRSADPANFETEVVNVKAAGNSNKTLNYAEVDNEPLPGISYYRLEQVDKDGSITHSKVVEINNVKSWKVTSLFPNPSEGTVYIGVYNPDIDQTVDINITDNVGKVLKTIKANLNVGNNQVKVDLSDLRKGLYLVNVHATGHLSFIDKLIKQ